MAEITQEELTHLLDERVDLITHVRDLRATLRDILRGLKDHRAHPKFSELYDIAIASLERNDP